MLTITIPESECWDEQKLEFVNIRAHTIVLEHSLLSISKWESKWQKCFLSKETKTNEEIIDYIRCMTVSPQNVDRFVYNLLTRDNIKDIYDYIESQQSATPLPKDKKETINKELITSELIYYWMISLNIPFECQKWHLSRLLALIRVCNIKNQPPKKMGKKELMSRNAQLNALRRQQIGTSG